MNFFAMLEKGREPAAPVEQYVQATLHGVCHPSGWNNNDRCRLALAMIRDSTCGRALLTAAQLDQFNRLVNTAGANYDLLTARPNEQSSVFEALRNSDFV